jgi:hypothetical protein
LDDDDEVHENKNSCTMAGGEPTYLVMRGGNPGYKNQSQVEKGFRFIKDKSFRVSEVYLKKPQRIEALSMIMVLTLMIYSVAEWKLR